MVRTRNKTSAFCIASALLLASAMQAWAQNESRIGSDFRREGIALEPCQKFKLAPCVETLVTGQPMHIAVGSLAPQNGFAAGLAFVEHKNFPSEWRLNFDLDAVASDNGSWRAGAYMKGYRLPGGAIHVVFPGVAETKKPKTSNFFSGSAPVFNLYAQAESLKHIDYFGLGPSTTPGGHVVFGLTETIAGADAIIPLAGKANISLLGQINGRLPSLDTSAFDGFPPINLAYNEANTPGLAQQPGFLQASEGLRARPVLAKGFLRLNYLLQFQQYVAPSASQYSFRRWNADFDHLIPIYRNVILTAARDQNGPDDCSGSSSPTGATPCPHVSLTRNLEGSIDLRLFMTGSLANAGHAVPFYFDPTLGGSDIDGVTALASYPDYRFRAPNQLVLRQTFEHSLGKLPLGFVFSADEAKVGLRRDDIDVSHLRHSFSTGITVHAGGLPVVSLLFSWGGNEGHHTSAIVSNTLLGASDRPSLF